MDRTIGCWSCGEPGEVIPGNSWLRRCTTCDVEWNAKPAVTLVEGR